MSERANIGRARGEPLVFDIDLKWSLWSAHLDHWLDFAPETYKHLVAGIEGGEIEESGEALVIRTAPRKEIRFGEVTINPKAGTVHVLFRSEFDDGGGNVVERERPIPSSVAELLVWVDAVESALITLDTSDV